MCYDWVKPGSENNKWSDLALAGCSNKAFVAGHTVLNSSENL
jgi:hypothetical protein